MAATIDYSRPCGCLVDFFLFLFLWFSLKLINSCSFQKTYSYIYNISSININRPMIHYDVVHDLFPIYFPLTLFFLSLTLLHQIFLFYIFSGIMKEFGNVKDVVFDVGGGSVMKSGRLNAERERPTDRESERESCTFQTDISEYVCVFSSYLCYLDNRFRFTSSSSFSSSSEHFSRSFMIHSWFIGK